MRLLVEVRRRGILKIATAYLAVSWLTLEIGHTLFNIFELPHAGLQFIFVLLALGFPLSLMGAWNGWFAAFSMDGDPHAHSPNSTAPHTLDGQDETEHAHGHHEGPLLAVVFGVVALIAVTTAIGIRFFGMAHETHGSGAGENLHAPAAPLATQAAPSKPESSSLPGTAAPPAFNPPEHSIAVLPFVNMSGDPAQEYFSDGLSEELLNSLVRINNLQVAARTSSFSFKGQKDDIEEIGRKLNVHSVLEGSVRKEGRRVRITAQLINAVTGFHLWSQTYDRDLKDVLELQTDIATAVTSALQATLLGTEASLIEVGGTKNPQAFDAFLRGQRDLRGELPQQEALLKQVAGFTEAIRLDPEFAKAYVGRAITEMELAGGSDTGETIRRRYADARADAEKAIALAPSMASAQAVMARVLWSGFQDYPGADASFRRAIAIGPGDADVLADYADFAANLGHYEEAIAAARRAVVLDPLTAKRYRRLSQVLITARQFPQALEAINRATSLDPKLIQATATRCLAQYAMGQLEAARQTCSSDPKDWWARTLLAITLHKLNRQDEAQSVLSKLVAELGDDASFQYAEVYSQWNDVPKALDALETAYRAKDPGLFFAKADLLLDPIRNEPRYQALVRKLNFPP